MSELKTYYLHCPLEVNVEYRNEYGDYTGEQEPYEDSLFGCLDELKNAVKNSRLGDEAERGLMKYFDGSPAIDRKVQYMYPDVDVVNGNVMGVVELRLNEMLTSVELDELKDYIIGQLADGWGEGFEQRPLKTEEGDLYVSFWSSSRDWELTASEELKEAVQKLESETGPQLAVKVQSKWRDTEPVELMLPADEKTIAFAMNRAGIADRDEKCYISEIRVLRKDLVGVDIQSIHEAEILAERLSQMTLGELSDTMHLLCELTPDMEAADGDYLIRLCDEKENYVHIPDAKNYEEVGRFLYENDLITEMSDRAPMDDATWKYLGEVLDYAKVGQKYTEQGYGFFTEYGYAIPLFDIKEPDGSYVRQVKEPEEPLSVTLHITPKQAAMIAGAMENQVLNPLAAKDAQRVIDVIACQVNLEDTYNPAQSMRGMEM